MGIPQESPNLPRSATGISGNSSYFSSVAIPLSQEPTPNFQTKLDHTQVYPQTIIPDQKYGQRSVFLRKSVSDDYSLRTDYVQDDFVPRNIGIERTKNVQNIHILMPEIPKMSRPELVRRYFRIKDDLKKCMLAEFVCIAILVFGGTSVIAQYVVGRGNYDMYRNFPDTLYFGVTIGFGLAFILAIHMSIKISGAHLNPAVSFMIWSFGQISFSRFLWYTIAQTAGAFVGAALTFLMYFESINAYDNGNPVVDGPLKTAGIFSTYPEQYLNVFGGMIDQIVGTAMLCITIATITDKRNQIPSSAQPTLIGLGLMLIGMAWGVNAGYAVNPARDFGPRLFTLCAGFNHYKWFWIPIVGPMVGGLLGGWIYQVLVGIHIPDDVEDFEDEVRRLQGNKVRANHHVVSMNHVNMNHRA